MMKLNSERKRRRMEIAQSRHGFTIIELLIVISILTILCAILLPALGRARDAGLASDCRGREKQKVSRGEKVHKNPLCLRKLFGADGYSHVLHTSGR